MKKAPAMKNPKSTPRLEEAEGGPTLPTSDAALWYQDAVIYQLNVKAFFDSNADGVGDFKGVASKLDYVKDLGVNTIWLMPFYPSPLKDDGYDISNYDDVHPQYGTLDDFKLMLIITLVCIPMLLFLRKPRRAANAEPLHAAVE